MDEKEAIKQLNTLVNSWGTLRIITNECVSAKCQGALHDESEAKVTDPSHFVIHNVTRVQGPNRRGLYAAHTEEGDWCMAQPETLLRRLLEANLGSRNAVSLPDEHRGLLQRLFGR